MGAGGSSCNSISHFDFMRLRGRLQRDYFPPPPPQPLYSISVIPLLGMLCFKGYNMVLV